MCDGFSTRCLSGVPLPSLFTSLPPPLFFFLSTDPKRLLHFVFGLFCVVVYWFCALKVSFFLSFVSVRTRVRGCVCLCVLSKRALAPPSPTLPSHFAVCFSFVLGVLRVLVVCVLACTITSPRVRACWCVSVRQRSRLSSDFGHRSPSAFTTLLSLPPPHLLPCAVGFFCVSSDRVSSFLLPFFSRLNLPSPYPRRCCSVTSRIPEGFPSRSSLPPLY